MIECRKAHRSKSFIESKLKTQVESDDFDTDRSSFEHKTSFILEGVKQFTIEIGKIDFDLEHVFIFNLL